MKDLLDALTALVWVVVGLLTLGVFWWAVRD